MKTFVSFLLLGFICHIINGYKLCDYLWQQTENERQAALDSVFVKAISNATLDPIQFGAYLVQDAIYLHSAKRSMDIAASRANDDTIKTFLQDNTIPRYTSLSTSALKDWHIQDPASIVLGDGCQSYVDHLLNVAVTLDPIYLIIANIPCEKLWPWIGEKIAVDTKDFGIYNKWVKENWDPNINVHLDFEKVVEDAFDNGKITKEKALEVYRQSMIGEVDFFNSVVSPLGQLSDAHDEL